ncbi:MAG: hypothetical protein OXI55_05015 [Gammaproteobacteria bacterium]|nr:hypothetical protein [Gammaproteobacteria bacterium]
MVARVGHATTQDHTNAGDHKGRHTEGFNAFPPKALDGKEA